MIQVVFLSCLVVYCGLAALVWRAPGSKLLDPLFWYIVFHGIVFVIRPAAVLFLGFDTVLNYMKIVPNEGEFCRALMVATLGLVCLVVGYRFGRKTAIMGQLVPQPVQSGVAKSFALMCFALAPLVAYSIVTTSRGVQGERVGGVYALVNTNGYVMDAQIMLLPLALFGIVLARFRWYSFLPLIAFLGYTMLFARVRWVLVIGVIAAYTLTVTFLKPRFKLLPLLALVPLTAVAFSLKGLHRGIFVDALNGRLGSTYDILSQYSWKERLDTQDFANFDYLTYIVSVVPYETTTYTYFVQWLQVFTEPIPRSLWKSKPYGAPIQFFDLNDYGNFIGLTPSLCGDGWMSLGWLGVALTCGATGIALGVLYRVVSRRCGDPLAMCAYIIFVALTIQLYRDGGISIFKFVLFAVGPLLILQRVARAAIQPSAGAVGNYLGRRYVAGSRFER